MAKDRQLVTPLEKLEKLTPFEGRPVLAVGVEIPGAGGGLRDALTVDPQEFHWNETVFIVIEGKVGKLRHDPIEDAGWRRVHVLEVQGATIAERETVERLLEEQAKRIEEAKGLQRLPFDEVEEAHNEGAHAEGLVDGCPLCDEEREAMEAENLERRDELADRRQAKAASDGD